MEKYKNYTINKENIGFEEDLENKKIKWNIGKLKEGEEVRITYKVVVNENCYGETIESTGTVENIPSAKVRNKRNTLLSQGRPCRRTSRRLSRPEKEICAYACQGYIGQRIRMWGQAPGKPGVIILIRLVDLYDI